MREAYTSAAKRPPPTGNDEVPAQARELRPQGRKTMRKLIDAGMSVFGERGFHAARVDDIVRAARTSHGTFYLYFANKEELLRALAVDCATEMEALVGTVGPISADDAGLAELRAFLEQFFATYRRYGPVIRAWMEGSIEDAEARRLGVHAFTNIATMLGLRMRDAGVPSDGATISALMAMLERTAYIVVSRNLDSDAVIDTTSLVVHRGFFGAPAAA